MSARALALVGVLMVVAGAAAWTWWSAGVHGLRRIPVFGRTRPPVPPIPEGALREAAREARERVGAGEPAEIVHREEAVREVWRALGRDAPQGSVTRRPAPAEPPVDDRPPQRADEVVALPRRARPPDPRATEPHRVPRHLGGDTMPRAPRARP